MLMKTNGFSFSRQSGGNPRLLQLSLKATAAIGILWMLSSAQAVATDETNAPAPAVSSAPPKKISGVELYAIHCNRCHPERYPVEFNEQQWKTLMLHMRVRANLPAAQAREIMKYLQEEAGN